MNWDELVDSWVRAARPPSSEHTRLEVLAAIVAGHRSGDPLPLADGVPVPGCICESCTLVPDRRPRAPSRSFGSFDVERARSRDIRTVAEQLGLGTPRKRGSESVVCCPFHDDTNPSLYLRVRTAGTDLWHCHPCGEGGDVIELVRRVQLMSFVDAVHWLQA